VQVSTVDEVKGLEFDFVIVPDAGTVDYPDTPLARRALYLAVTRARHQVVLTCVGEPRDSSTPTSSAARIQHPAGHGEPDVVDDAMKFPLALIDDLGSERDTAANAVPDVIFARHAEDLPLWVTTGLTRAQLRGRYGAGIVGRLFERATVIPVGGNGAGKGESP
jgi:ATP-dependent exoDNAse (exonuclease V) beta subunit